MEAQGFGSPLGLTNDRITSVRARLERGLDLNGHDLHVLSTATLQLEVTRELYTEEKTNDPLVRIVLPRLRRLRGKVLKFQGFNNSAIDELLAAK